MSLSMSLFARPRARIVLAVLIAGVADAVLRHVTWPWGEVYPRKLVSFAEALVRPPTWLAALLAWISTLQVIRLARAAQPPASSDASQAVSPPLLYPEPGISFLTHLRIAGPPLFVAVALAHTLRQAILLADPVYRFKRDTLLARTAEYLFVVTADLFFYASDALIAAVGALAIAWIWAVRRAEEGRTTLSLMLGRVVLTGILLGCAIYLADRGAWATTRAVRRFFDQEEVAFTLFTVDKGMWQILFALPVLVPLLWTALRRRPVGVKPPGAPLE